MSKSSLSSVVSDLVRASMGSSVSNTVTDEDLDRHVAELILKEAKQKAERYGTEGYKAYLPNGALDSNAPRTNKRFLSSIIRSTDDHNKTILRAQALAAQEIKREREKLEREERKARAEEAVAAERMRRLMGGGRRVDRDDWDRGKRRDKKRRDRSWEEEGKDGSENDSDFDRDRYRDPGKQRRRSHTSRSAEQESRREKYSRYSRMHDKDGSSSPRHERDRTRSQSPTRNIGDKESEGRGSKRHRSHDRHRSHRRRRSSSPMHRPRSPPIRDERSRSHRRARSPSAGPSVDPDSESKPRSSTDHRSPTQLSSTNDFTATDRELELRRKLKGKNKAGQDDVETSSMHRPSNSVSRVLSRSRSITPEAKSFNAHGIVPKATTSSSRTASSSDRHRSPSPHPTVSQLPSKMDKYFQESYDPRLDVASLTAPKVPATGLINNADFEGWDTMLELIRLRREDKEEKKRMERLGIGKDKTKDRKDQSGRESASDRWSGDAVSIMDIEYKKKGSVREWDLGKDGF